MHKSKKAKACRKKESAAWAAVGRRITGGDGAT